MATLTTFQLIVLPFIALVIVVTGIATGRNRMGRRTGVAWIVLWLAAAIFIARPDYLVTLANLLGIGRGADLALYASILFTFAGFFVLYLRYRKVTEQLTAIVRHLAIAEAERAAEDADAPAEALSRGQAEKC